jgi:hypothetical protein
LVEAVAGFIVTIMQILEVRAAEVQELDLDKILPLLDKEHTVKDILAELADTPVDITFLAAVAAERVKLASLV